MDLHIKPIDLQKWDAMHACTRSIMAKEISGYQIVRKIMINGISLLKSGRDISTPAHCSERRCFWTHPLFARRRYYITLTTSGCFSLHRLATCGARAMTSSEENNTVGCIILSACGHVY